MKTYNKVLTHDLRPPIQGGDPVITGSLPFRLPQVAVDKMARVCSYGWNASRTPEDALRLSGFWPDGRPSRMFRLVEPDGLIERGDKVRARAWTVLEEIDVRPAIEALSRRWFGDHAEAMNEEQVAWCEALARPNWNVEVVKAGLRAALDARRLTWRLRRFESARDIWDARDTWDAWDASDAQVAWSAWVARDAKGARVAWDAWDTWGARVAWSARVAWDARVAWSARNTWDARIAWDARRALTLGFVSRQGWVQVPPDRLTIGLRDACRYGLAIALPTGPDELGWVMVGRPREGR